MDPRTARRTADDTTVPAADRLAALRIYAADRLAAYRAEEDRARALMDAGTDDAAALRALEVAQHGVAGWDACHAAATIALDALRAQPPHDTAR